jgi:hypothetical protein
MYFWGHIAFTISLENAIQISDPQVSGETQLGRGKQTYCEIERALHHNEGLQERLISRANDLGVILENNLQNKYIRT